MGRRSRALHAGKVVLALYREMQPQVDAAVERNGPVSCRPGCNACCRLLTLTDLPQMVPVVEYLTRRPDWEERKARLLVSVTEHLLAVRETGLPQEGNPDERATTAYWELQLPCVFLAGGLCSVYESRPGVCRYYEVVSPAEDCAGPAGTRIGSVDLRQAADTVTFAGVDATGEILIGTIPTMFVLACRALGVDFPVEDELVRAGVLVHALVK